MLVRNLCHWNEPIDFVPHKCRHACLNGLCIARIIIIIADVCTYTGLPSTPQHLSRVCSTGNYLEGNIERKGEFD